MENTYVVARINYGIKSHIKLQNRFLAYWGVFKCLLFNFLTCLYCKHNVSSLLLISVCFNKSILSFSFSENRLVWVIIFKLHEHWLFPQLMQSHPLLFGDSIELNLLEGTKFKTSIWFLCCKDIGETVLADLSITGDELVEDVTIDVSSSTESVSASNGLFVSSLLESLYVDVMTFWDDILNFDCFVSRSLPMGLGIWYRLFCCWTLWTKEVLSWFETISSDKDEDDICWPEADFITVSNGWSWESKINFN